MEVINMRTGSWGKLVAFFDVRTQEGFIIKGFKLVNGINGFFVGFPSEKRKDENDEDKYYDTVWLTDEVRESMREQLNKMAENKYNQESGADTPVSPIANENEVMADEPAVPPAISQDDAATEKPVDAGFSEDDLPF